jgi:hypothetical protein
MDVLIRELLINLRGFFLRHPVQQIDGYRFTTNKINLPRRNGCLKKYPCETWGKC